MRVVVSGASGLVGSRLVPALRAQGHDVLRLVRRRARTADEVAWDPQAGLIDAAALAGVEGAVHLAGAGLGDRRWTSSYKREIRESRVLGTTLLAATLAALDPLPRVLVSGSAIGFYGDTGDRPVDEDAPRGAGFLAEVVEAWERSAAPARAAGIRVVHARSGLVVAGEGGTWGSRLTPLFRLGLGGRIGDGRQYWSFVSITDEVRALITLLTDEQYVGPVNLTAPHPLTNAEVTRAMGATLHRPTVLHVPAFALRAVLGEFAGDVLTGQRVVPRKLEVGGFAFDHPTFTDAFAASLSPH